MSHSQEQKSWLKVSKEPPARLEAGPFRLRSMDENDWATEIALSEDPEVLRWTHYRPGMTEEIARARLRRAASSSIILDTDRYVILDGEMTIGVAGIFMNDGETPEIYFALVPAGRRRGAATLATKSLSE